MNKIKLLLLSIVVASGVTVAFMGSSVGAVTCNTAAQKDTVACKVSGGADQTGVSKTCQDKAGKVVDCMAQTIETVVNVMLFIIGALSVIMIIVGGIRYVTSTGDSSRVKAAKDTIMYAVVGLIVALFAYAIVNFVVDKLG